MSFDARKKKILSGFINSNGPITGKYLSKAVGVSSRTIRNDIKLLNKELNKKGVRITSNPGIGYSIEPNNKDSIKILKDLTKSKKDLPILPEERVFYIIKKLLYSDDYITLENLAEELYVSKSTIVNDVNRVEEWLMKRNLKLHKKPNYGIKIEGDEINLRFSISDYLTNLKLRYDNVVENQQLREMLADIDVDKIKNIILESYKDMPLKLSDMAFNNLVIHIAIAIKRIREGKKIFLPHSEINSLRYKKEYSISEKIVSELEKDFCIDIPDEEKGYITIHLLGTKALKDKNLDNREIKNTIGNSLMELIEEMVKEVYRVYNVDFSDDKDLLYGLALHLRTTLNRLKYNMNLRNPLLKEIKEEYPHAFEMAITASKVLEKIENTSIDENEIGYIAMHFGAAIERKKYLEKKERKRIAIICATGMGTAQFLASKIKKTFINVDIIGVFPSYKIDEILSQKPDLILSTVPLEVKDIPTIHISTLLSKGDLERVNRALENSTETDDKELLIDLFDKDLFITNIEHTDKFQVIKDLSRLLYDKNIVKENYEHSIVEREKISSTSIGNLIAIPHAILGNAISSKIAVGILKKPIKWGKDRVQLVFLLAFEKMSDKYFEKIFDVFFQIINDKTKVLKLISAKNFDDFINILRGN
ncbi:BglG family transcription antiterminator [Thermohalobacter berrensis]|uniref:Transcriptional antiterminator BglG n=1 Tax=Thermohalobacter berrensis TaxID=99594 RepID=A0A419T2Y3_9FIRM|nr:BglG family transcription antiterminator [Thermohalobacter berrensis]RKD31793.1 transcriptional antiterminator BglG [Thermohalobacter berrensis]